MRAADRSHRRRRLIVVAVAAPIAACVGWLGRATPAGPAEGTAFSGPAAVTPAGPRLRLATFNIDGGHGRDGKLDLTRTAKCLQRLDLIALQEVHGDGSGNQAAALSHLLRLPFEFAPAERRWGHDSFGNAVLTDLPVTAWHRVVIPTGPLAADRNYVSLDLTWQGRPLHVIATHVDFKSNGDDQLRKVIETFLSLPEPAVLMGDLNHPAADPQIAALARTPGVQEAVGQVLDPVPGRVDWIFLRGLRAVDAGPVELGASDHPAYWAEVRLIGPAATSPASPATRPSSRRSTPRPPVPARS